MEPSQGTLRVPGRLDHTLRTTGLTTVSVSASEQILKESSCHQYYGPIGKPEHNAAGDDEDDEDCGENGVHPTGFTSQYPGPLHIPMMQPVSGLDGTEESWQGETAWVYVHKANEGPEQVISGWRAICDTLHIWKLDPAVLGLQGNYLWLVKQLVIH